MDAYTQVLSPTGSSILDRPWTIIYKKTHSATSPGLGFFFLSVSSFIVFFVLFVFFNFFSFLFSFPRLFFSSLLLLLLLLSPLIYNLFIRFLFFLYLPDPFSPHLQGSATFLSDKPLSIFIIPGNSWENTTCLHSIYC